MRRCRIIEVDPAALPRTHMTPSRQAAWVLYGSLSLRTSCRHHVEVERNSIRGKFLVYHDPDSG